MEIRDSLGDGSSVPVDTNPHVEEAEDDVETEDLFLETAEFWFGQSSAG